MPTPSWEEIEALSNLIVKAVREAVGNISVDPETFDELVTEGKLAAYKALQDYDPTKADKLTWVFRSVIHHIHQVLPTYLPIGVQLSEEPKEVTVLWRKASGESGMLSSPLALAVLLTLAPPSERLYILHELLDWGKPPRYSKTRLKRRWQETEWVRLLTGHFRWTERKALLADLCLQAEQGNPRDREIAGFALAAISQILKETGHFGNWEEICLCFYRLPNP